VVLFCIYLVLLSLYGRSSLILFLLDPVTSIVVVALDTIVERTDDQTGQDTADDGKGKGVDEGGNLDTTLLACTVASAKVGLKLIAVLLRVGTSSSDDGRDDGSEDTGHAVKVVNTAGIVQMDLLLEVGLDIIVAEAAEQTGKAANADSTTRVDGHAGAAAHSDTTSEGGVLDVDHAELMLLAEEDGESEGHHASSAKGEDGVDDSTVLDGAGRGKNSVEAGPEHPQEDGTDHGKEIRHAAGNAELVVALVLAANDKSDGKAKVCTEGVDNHGATKINDTVDGLDEDLVCTVEDDLDDGKDEKLQRRSLAEHGTESDHDRGSGKVTLNESRDIEMDLVPFSIILSAGVELVEERVDENSPLNTFNTDEEVQAKRTVAVALQEHHQETETNKHHHMNISKEGILAKSLVATEHLRCGVRPGAIGVSRYAAVENKQNKLDGDGSPSKPGQALL